MNLLKSLTLRHISGLVLQRYLNKPMICLYNVALTNSSFVLFFNFALVSNGVAAALQLLILNLFKISWTYFLWCRNTSSSMFLNSIPNKYDKFPRSYILNSCISFDLTLLIYVSYARVIKNSSKYKHTMIRLTLFASLTYTPYSKTHFVKPALIKKLYILLF